MRQSEIGSTSKGQLVGLAGNERAVDRRNRPENESEMIQQMLAEKILIMEENSQKIAVRDTQISRLTALAKRKDAEIQRLESQINVLKSDIDNRHSETGNMVAGLQEEIEALNKELDENDQLLEELQKTIQMCMAKVKLMIGTRTKELLNQSSGTIHFKEFMKDLDKSERSIHDSSMMHVSRRHNKSSNTSFQVAFRSEELVNLLSQLEQKIRQDAQILIKRDSDCNKLGKQIAVMQENLDEQRKAVKLLKEQLAVSEEDVNRLKDKHKMLEEIYKQSEQSRSLLIKASQQIVTRGMSKDSSNEKSIEELRTTKRHLQQKIEELEKKLQTVMQENVLMRIESTRQSQQMLANMRRLQKHFDERVHQKEMELRGTLRQSR